MSVIEEIQINNVRLQLIALNDRPNQVFWRFFISMIRVSELSAAIASLAAAACIVDIGNNKIGIVTRKKVQQ